MRVPYVPGLGSKILLNGHTGYRGDFDVTSKATTATHALYTRDEASGRELMYHCAPLIKAQAPPLISSPSLSHVSLCPCPLFNVIAVLRVMCYSL